MDAPKVIHITEFPQVDWLFFDKAYAQKVLMSRRSLWPSNETVLLGAMPH